MEIVTVWMDSMKILLLTHVQDVIFSVKLVQQNQLVLVVLLGINQIHILSVQSVVENVEIVILLDVLYVICLELSPQHVDVKKDIMMMDLVEIVKNVMNSVLLAQEILKTVWFVLL